MIKVPAGLFPGLFPGLSSWLAGGHLLTVSLHGREKERASSGLSSSTYKDTNPITGAPPSWLYLSLVTSQIFHFQIPSQVVGEPGRASICECWGGDTNIQSLTLPIRYWVNLVLLSHVTQSPRTSPILPFWPHRPLLLSVSSCIYFPQVLPPPGCEPSKVRHCVSLISELYWLNM